MKRSLWITLLVVLGVGIFVFSSIKSTQNTMVTLEEGVVAQWAQVENVYQRRADLIPNLVSTVKGYANFEQGVLTDVAEARAKATSVQITAKDLDDPQLVEKFNSSQNQLSQAFGRLLSVQENYPDLKANVQFQALMTELEGTENRISVERKKFNEAARAYNTHIKQFPANIFANMLGFEEKAYFTAAPSAQQVPTVDFSK